jgi:predicted transcriptional regulator
MRTAVTIPDDVFADAERLARRLAKSRSQLYSHALREYISRHASDRVTAALDKIYAGETSDDPAFARSVARRRLRRVEW